MEQRYQCKGNVCRVIENIGRIWGVKRDYINLEKNEMECGLYYKEIRITIKGELSESRWGEGDIEVIVNGKLPKQFEKICNKLESGLP